MLLSIYSLYGQGPFYPKLYIKGCHFSENYVQKRVFGQGTRVWAISLPFLYINAPTPPPPTQNMCTCIPYNMN